MLINFFYTLRAAKLPVSVKEYLNLLDALKQGVVGPMSADGTGHSLDEFYYLNNLMKITYQDFERMPIFIRKYLLDKWIEENKKD